MAAYVPRKTRTNDRATTNSDGGDGGDGGGRGGRGGGRRAGGGARGGGGGGGGGGGSDVELSKSMSWLLRHGAERERVPISDDGFVRVSALLAHRRMVACGASEQRVRAVVAADAKQRYTLRELDDGTLLVRANQGHSMTSVHVDMRRLTVDDAPAYPTVVHGTYRRVRAAIERDGLRRMTRQHIHCAAGVPGDAAVRSGARHNVEVLVFIDLAAALRDGVEFYVSSNGVILTPGVGADGVLPPKYFAKIVERS